MTYLLALDQGTTSSRAIVFDADGAPRATAQQEFAQYFPQPGWVEHDATEIWQSQYQVARRALDQLELSPRDVAAIGITNQRETTVIWDRRTGAPIARAIVWQDRRTTAHCQSLKDAGLEPLVQGKTGLVLDPYFSATKIAWILANVPGARTRAVAGELAFGTIDSWLIWNLTGGAIHATDPTNASRTLLFNLATDDWDDELLELFEVPRAILPEIVPSSGIVGYTTPSLFGGAIAIAGIAGDQQAAMVGQARLRPGTAKNTYGTGCFMLLHTGADRIRSESGLLTTRAAAIGAPQFALEGSVFIGGAVVQWLRDGLGIIAAAGEIEALAATVPDADGVILVPAFTGLGAPYWDPRARGTIVGITRGTTRAHFARAALESIALQTADVLHAMQRDAATTLAELRVDGGASANDLLMQMQADFLGIPVVRPRTLETTALGAAYLAGLGAGVWANQDMVEAKWQSGGHLRPAIQAAERDARLARWRRAVERARHWHEE